MHFISSFYIISVVVPKWDVPNPKIFTWIPASDADAVTVSPNGISTLLFNGMSTFFTNGKPTFINGPRTL